MANSSSGNECLASEGGDKGWTHMFNWSLFEAEIIHTAKVFDQTNFNSLNPKK